MILHETSALVSTGYCLFLRFHFAAQQGFLSAAVTRILANPHEEFVVTAETKGLTDFLDLAQ
jgi:hypothetical protein